MDYLIVQTNLRFRDLQWVLKRHGIELEQRPNYWRAILFDRVDDPERYVGEIVLDAARFFGDVDVSVDLEQTF